MVADIADAVSDDTSGCIIAVEVTAGAGKNLFPAGYNEWRRTIGCRVSAPALEGRANKALLSLIAGCLDIPVSAVSIRSGATSSQKRVHVAGVGKKEIVVRLGPLLR